MSRFLNLRMRDRVQFEVRYAHASYKEYSRGVEESRSHLEQADRFVRGLKRSGTIARKLDGLEVREEARGGVLDTLLELYRSALRLNQAVGAEIIPLTGGGE